ncbi:MAG: hypothetical protein QG608_1101 [Actinomycetota bacterium]|nr:hypothetical protein [Actinomycetota bacterium]
MHHGGSDPWPALAAEELAPLWTALHARLCSGSPVARVRLPELTDDQRQALADLLGQDRLPPPRPSVSLNRVEHVLREVADCTVQEAVTRIVGPLEDRAARRAQERAERSGLWTWLESHEVVRAQPALADWVQGIRQAGIRQGETLRTGATGGSASRTRHELEQVLHVLEHLPAPGVPLPRFADRVLGDPHALDDGTRCAGLVLRALAAVYAVATPSDAAGRRALWARAGVADDDLSSTVLLAGLRPLGEGPVDVVLRTCAGAGQAAALTLAQVRSFHPSAGPEFDVRVVENPTVLALALSRFGPGCPPVVCPSGWPSAAGTLLLKRLADGGFRLHYHGDLDGEGLRIAAHVMAGTGAVPWRMSAADYAAAVGDGRGGPPVGRVTDAPWDADLAPLLREHGTCVPEERVADTLLDDLLPPG